MTYTSGYDLVHILTETKGFSYKNKKSPDEPGLFFLIIN